MLAAVMALSLAACGNGDTPTGGGSDADASSYREPYKSDEVSKEAFVDTDGDFEYETVEWSGPEGYVIVVPKGDSGAKETADYLQDYYTRVHSITLKVVTDATKETEKEILIGKTNRKQSSAQLEEGDIKVSLQGEKLVFEGGHSVTTEAAVKRFIRLMPDKNEAFTFTLTTDFTTALTIEGMEDYKYVWGDEFEDWYDVDFGKWTFANGMSGSPSMVVCYDRDVVDIGDGRLKLRAINSFDSTNPDVLFKVPGSVSTSATMNFKYGYAEIRARLPFFEGSWPSFWGGTLSHSKVGVLESNPQWHAEVDVFEIFGSEDALYPNIHKWYDNYPYEEIYETGDDDHSNYISSTHPRLGWVFQNPENLEQEYHTYGYEWTPTEMSFYVDGEKYCTLDIVNTFDLESNMTMFHDPQYLQFNNHLFVEDASYHPNLIYDNVSLLPAEYFIDYFRLYQKNDGKSKVWTNTSARGSEPENRVKEIKIDND